MSAQRVDSMLHFVAPVEGFVDGRAALKDHVASGFVEGEFLVDGDDQSPVAVSNDEISFVHDFELLNGDSFALVTIQEFGFGPSARSNYRVASSAHAPKGEAARLRAGVGAACA